MTTSHELAPSGAGAPSPAVEDLGAAVRRLACAVVDTTMDDAALARAADLAREAAALLERSVRGPSQIAAGDEHGPVGRTYSPVSGLGNPVSPPLRVVSAEPSGVVTECAVHRVHEGPPTYVHGGMSAMLMDQVLGMAVAVAGRSGLTRSLEMRYHRPVPLGESLTLTGRLIASEEVPGRGRRTEAAGQIVATAQPDVVLVSATAIFITPTADQVARIFGHVETGGAPVRAGD